MIEPTDFGYAVSCDFCSTEIELQLRDFDLVLKAIRGRGWTIVKEGDEWLHKCPAHAQAKQKTAKLVENSQVAIDCPVCKEQGLGSVKLVVKTNRKTDHQFLGCPNWPECDHTCEIPESLIMRLKGQPELF